MSVKRWALLLLLPLLLAPAPGSHQEQSFDLVNEAATSDAIEHRAVYDVTNEPPPPVGSTILTPQGITFTFDTTYQKGTYLDGQPWVVENTPGAGVRIIRMQPDYAPGRNGWWENKRAFKQINYGEHGCVATGNCMFNGVDDRMATATANNGWAFVAPTAWYGPLPRTIPAGTSIAKARSVSNSEPECSGNSSHCIQDWSVLTVLSVPPPANSMRPPLGGPSTVKPHFVLTGFNIATGLPNLPLLGTNQWSLAEVASGLYNYPPWVGTFVSGEFDGSWIPRDLHKLTNPTVGIHYGCDTGLFLNAALLRISQVGSASEKAPIFYNLLQAAIDHYYAEVDGKSWDSTGCIHHGRKSLIMWGGKILNSISANQGRAAAMAAYNDGTEAIDRTTYTSSAAGEALWGYEATSGSLTDPDGRRCLAPQTNTNFTASQCDGLRDGGNHKFGDPKTGSACGPAPTYTEQQPTIAFQRANNCVTMTAYQGMSDVYWGACAVARVYGLVEEWTAARDDNDPAWIGYCDRWHTGIWANKDHCLADHCDAYLDEMFMAYGCNTPACIAARGGVND